MKAILLDEAKKWLEENCENQYTRMAVFGIMQSMPTVDYQETPNEWVEALEAINNAAVAYMEGGPYENDLPGMEFAVEIDRLSRDFVRPPNEALTWSELAEMEGQPVYIVEMGARRYWALVIYVGKDTAYFATLNDPDDHGDKELYGESWVAYRRPKEEEGKPTEPPNV